MGRLQESLSVDCIFAGMGDFVINQYPWHAGFCVLRAFAIVPNHSIFKVRALAKIEFSGGLTSNYVKEELHQLMQRRQIQIPENKKSLRSDPKTLEVVGTAGFEPATPTTPR